MRRCSSPRVRRWETGVWVRDVRAHNRRRRGWLEVLRVEPYTGAGRRWAIPWPIVYCESSGSDTADNGANDTGYAQVLTSTWLANGGGRFASEAKYASHWDQSVIVARIWDHGRGAGQWQCASMVSY